jgi:hypothetical protein
VGRWPWPAVGALAAEVLHFTDAAPTWVVALVALLSILSGGLTTYKKGWIALKNRNLNINALMSIAVTGADPDRPVAGSGDGDVPVYRGRADRGQVPRPCAQRHQRL